MLIVIDSHLSRHAISSWMSSFTGARVKRKRGQAKTHPMQVSLNSFIVTNFNSADLQLLQKNVDRFGSLNSKDVAPTKKIADILNKLFAFSLWEAYESDLRSIRSRDILEIIWQADHATQLDRQQTARELACWRGVLVALHSGIAADAEAREIAQAAPSPELSRASAQRL